MDFSFSDLGFKTDTGISGASAGVLRERVLQKWSSDEPESPKLHLDSKRSQWDQFETNERLFGVDTDFNEEDYTTKLDRSNPDFRDREAKAIRLAKEIESSVSSNTHVAEERGQMVQGTGDEEERYSSVIRQDAKKYVPPSAREEGKAVSWSQVVVKVG